MDLTFTGQNSEMHSYITYCSNDSNDIEINDFIN